MTLILRKVVHDTAIDNYRVVYDDVEIGSIGVQMGTNAETFWAWGIDTVMPPDSLTMHGKGENREDCMVQFKAAWHKFSRNPERLEDFMLIKRELQRKWRGN